ncbi:MAG: FIST C-terminal domain-containing protein, partial [Synergistaceae bacterium]|nr:FIST C-terminal domain-containing protein [Synergistaceae bacterium]
DYNDGTTPVVRAVFANTPEGYAVCGGDIPVGATLSVGTIDMNEIIATATGALKSALASKPDCILIFSCVGRYFYMGYEPMREIEEAKGILDPLGLPYQITYSGGEFCPVYSGNKEGQTINRNHNDTIVICTL